MYEGTAPSDRYVVLEYLAEGGMGAIYLGRKLGAGGFEKDVVLKQLLPEYTQHEEFRELFLREAKLSATLDHANIVHTIDLVTAGSHYFIVMEYLPGGDLRGLLKRARRRHRRLSPAAAILIAREILAALAYAHAKRDSARQPLRLIHRDVSPSNILISVNGEVKLTDFGIAKAATHNSLFYRVKGKVGYMSPEQAKSEPLDHRADLYSLAVCFYEALTNERLFVNVGLTVSADEMYRQPVPLPSRKVSGIPADLDKVILRALSLDPAARYQTAGEFQEALSRCAHRHGLFISPTELAAEVIEACGDPETWRDGDADAEAADAPPRASTEVYQGLDDEDRSQVAHVAPSPHDAAVMRARQLTSMTSLAPLKNLELTSVIGMLEEAGAAGAGEGAWPLIDLDQLGRERSAPVSAPVSAPPPGGDLPTPAWAQLPPPLAADVPAAVPPPVPRAGRGASRRLIIGIVLGVVAAAIGVAVAIGVSGPAMPSAPPRAQPRTP